MKGDDNELERRTSRELHFVSLNEKLRYVALILLGLPLVGLIHVVFVLRVIDLFRLPEGTGFVVPLLFAAMLGFASAGIDFWFGRWFIEEIRVYRWSGSAGRSRQRDSD